MSAPGVTAASIGPVAKIVHGPQTKYLGLVLVLAWHYCIWFVPSYFPVTFLLEDRITFSWLLALAAAGIVPLALAWHLGRTKQLGASPLIIWPVAAVGSVATIGLPSAGMLDTVPWFSLGAAAMIGSSAGFLWVAWGERLACQRAQFTMKRVAPIYGGVMIAAIGITTVLPSWYAPAFVALLPLVSAYLLRVQAKEFTECAPRLLPAKAAVQGKHTIVSVTLISFAAAFVCYYTVAIVPWSALGEVQNSFPTGILIGAVLILLLVAAHVTIKRPRSPFNVYPHLLLLTVVACVLYLAHEQFGAAAFLLAVAVSSLFEILLTLYMGVLTRRGYASPALSFSLSGSAVRLGICGGNSLALIYERVPGLHETLVRPTFVVLIAVVAGLMITMVRQEYAIEDLTRAPEAASELQALSDAVAEEFLLSPRETEIMGLIGRGYTAAAVAEQLVISPYTVNTHIQNIYRKMGVNKRSELIAYLHGRA